MGPHVPVPRRPKVLDPNIRCKYVPALHSGPRADRLSVFGGGAHVVEATAAQVTVTAVRYASFSPGEWVPNISM